MPGPARDRYSPGHPALDDLVQERGLVLDARGEDRKAVRAQQVPRQLHIVIDGPGFVRRAHGGGWAAEDVFPRLEPDPPRQRRRLAEDPRWDGEGRDVGTGVAADQLAEQQAVLLRLVRAGRAGNQAAEEPALVDPMRVRGRHQLVENGGRQKRIGEPDALEVLTAAHDPLVDVRSVEERRDHDLRSEAVDGLAELLDARPGRIVPPGVRVDFRHQRLDARVDKRQDLLVAAPHDDGNRVALVQQAGQQGLSQRQVAEAVESEDYDPVHATSCERGSSDS